MDSKSKVRKEDVSMGENETIFYVEDMYCLHNTFTCVTVRVTSWHYHIDRVKLTMIEGYYKTSEEIDNALSEKRRNQLSEHPKYPEDPEYPRCFEIICRPCHMLDIAKALAKISETLK